MRELTVTDTQVQPQLLQLMHSWRHQPAIILDPQLEVLAMNVTAERLYGRVARETNLARFVFGNPAAHEFLPDWPKVARDVVAGLRVTAAADPRSAPLRILVTELTAASADFRSLWSRSKDEPQASGLVRLRHPETGELRLNFQVFGVDDRTGQQLVVFQHAGH
jgi:transcription regulator MmyB-like protein